MSINETTGSKFKHSSMTVEESAFYRGIYPSKKADGIEFFEEFRAWGTKMIAEGTITMLEALSIETALSSVKAWIITGDWKTGQALFSSITVSDLEDKQDIYDYVNDTINNYVTSNY